MTFLNQISRLVFILTNQNKICGKKIKYVCHQFVNLQKIYNTKVHQFLKWPISGEFFSSNKLSLYYQQCDKRNVTFQPKFAKIAAIFFCANSRRANEKKGNK